MAGPEGSGSAPAPRSPADERREAVLDQPFAANELYALRAAVAAHAAQLGLPAEQAVNVLIVAGELATNAIRHGGGGGRLRLWRDGSVLYCQVSDRGPGISDAAVGTTPPRPTEVGGRGIWIARQISDQLTIQPGDGGRGTTVTAAIRLDRRHAQPEPRR